MNELEREMLMAPPFDVEPIINGNVTVLDKDMQDKIMRHVRGSVRLASRKIVIPDVLLLYNPGVRWLCVTTVVVSEPLDHVRIAAWQTVHSDLLNELSRYCVEQARNALSIGAEDAAKSWLAAKGKLTGISAFCIQGESTDGNMQARNEMLYGQALSVAEEAVSLQGQALDLAVLKNMDVDSCLLAARESWLRNNGCSEESPLVRKYLAWGAESSAKIPSWCLKVKDGFVNKDLIRVNLGVVAASYDDLFEQLNRNVEEYFAKSEMQMRDLVDEYMCGYMYEGKDPVSALVDKLESLVAMLNDRGTLPPETPWWPVLAEALRLPRYTIQYFDWSRVYPDEGPNEPGYFYSLPDGSSQEVHCSIMESKWWAVMDDVEYCIENIIHGCMDISAQMKDDLHVNQWAEVEAMWNQCSDSESACHCYGDTDSFAKSFCKNVIRFSILARAWTKRKDTVPDELPAVRIAGFTREGRAEAVRIAQTTAPVKGWFTGPVLSKLFSVHVNTISNWLKKPSSSPKGFLEAYKKQDAEAMRKIAKMYASAKSKADAMGTKHVARDLSEEQIYRQGGGQR